MKLRARVGDRTAEVEVRGKDGRYTVTRDGNTVEIDLADTGDHFESLLVEGHSHDLGIEARPGGYRVHGREGTVTVELEESSANGTIRRAAADGPVRLTAPMPGRVVRVLAAKEQDVDAGEGLVVIEAMKMENELKAPRKGRVSEVAVQEGQAVDAGALLVVVA